MERGRSPSYLTIGKLGSRVSGSCVTWNYRARIRDFLDNLLSGSKGAGPTMAQQQQFCPECGGTLFYDSPAKRYICRSCGLYVTKEEISDLRAKIRSEMDGQRRRKREHSEYLEWWLSKKA